jgi:hypothetical protein
LSFLRFFWLRFVGRQYGEVRKRTVTIQELLVSSLAQTDALAKLLIEKGVITQHEFLTKIAEERATYQRILTTIRRQTMAQAGYKDKRIEVEIQTDTFKIRGTLFVPLAGEGGYSSRVQAWHIKTKGQLRILRTAEWQCD